MDVIQSWLYWYILIKYKNAATPYSGIEAKVSEQPIQRDGPYNTRIFIDINT